MSLVECSEGILLREALEGIEVKRLFFAASFFFYIRLNESGC